MAAEILPTWRRSQYTRNDGAAGARGHGRHVGEEPPIRSCPFPRSLPPRVLATRGRRTHLVTKVEETDRETAEDDSEVEPREEGTPAG